MAKGVPSGRQGQTRFGWRPPEASPGYGSRRSLTVRFADGHAVSRPNKERRFTVDVRNYGELRDAFNKMLGVLEQADAEF